MIAFKRFIHGYFASFSISFEHAVNPLLSRFEGGGLFKRGEGVIESSKQGTIL